MHKGKITSSQHDGQSQLDAILEQFRGFSTRGQFTASWSVEGDNKKLTLEVGPREPQLKAAKAKSSKGRFSKPPIEPETPPPAIDTTLDDSPE